MTVFRMTSVFLNRRAVLAGLGTAVFAAPVTGAEQAGEVQAARGECFAEGGAGRRELATTAPVYIGESVGTEAQSALRLHLGVATVVSIGPQARLRIDRFVVDAGGTLVLERGPMLCDYQTTGAGKHAMDIRSPFGLIAVRGTSVWCGPSKGVFGVFVRHGTVAVTAASRTVMVGSGFGTDIARPGAEPSVPILWGEARIREALNSVDAG